MTATLDSTQQSQIAFHLAGRLPDAERPQQPAAAACPALLAGRRELPALRYDFPVVLASGERFVRPLSAIIDEVIHAAGTELQDHGPLTHHLLRLEREIRSLLAAGEHGTLASVWDGAARLLVAGGDAEVEASLDRARRALKADGDLVDCDRSLPGAFAGRAWHVVQEAKSARLAADLRRLIIGLTNILGADRAQSRGGRSPERLRASLGQTYESVFDFDALSRVLSTQAHGGLAPPRRERIEGVLAVLRAQRFVHAPSDDDAHTPRGYGFEFTSCTDALTAYRERLPRARELARAVAVAELEVRGEYRDGVHDALFGASADDDFGRDTLALLPDYFVSVPMARVHGEETDSLMELLSAGVPAKVLVQADDLLEESTVARDGHFAVGMRARQLASMALGLADVFVMQAPASLLYQMREAVRRGMAFDGPALFSVFSGASGGTTLPPFLVAAAALESRAFPAFTFDPSAGPNWASRFDLSANPQTDRDWPSYEIAYEDDGHRLAREQVEFTFVDFVAADVRHASHLAPVKRAAWNDRMVPVHEYLRGTPDAGRIPFVSVVTDGDVLYRAVTDDRLVRAARRCREAWHSLQELGGIHNSHAERLLAREATAMAAAAAAAPTAVPATAPAAMPASAPAGEAAAPAAEERDPDLPYIETMRCTTCNECTQVNTKMFAYNENKQAYIKDPDAGTFAQLVEAAESCQVSIIHPGKPRNPGEPGLAELLKRAAPFA
ncbi:MAG: hypothetical protein U9Q74_11210 [Gemmatimonadota bacterium]|nr:hypothetical protein [Gemmatimonadota bacterium]